MDSDTITNLLINSNQFEYPDMKDNVGLFGYAVKATIKRVGVQGNLEIYSCGKYIGGIAAFANHIEDVYGDREIAEKYTEQLLKRSSVLNVQVHFSLLRSFDASKRLNDDGTVKPNEHYNSIILT